MSAERVPGGIEPGITVVAAPTEKGDLLVSRGERTLGVVLRESGGIFAYPCTPGFPRLGPFDGVEVAVGVCARQAEAPEQRFAADDDEGELVFGAVSDCPHCGAELARNGDASSYASCRSCNLVFLG